MSLDLAQQVKNKIPLSAVIRHAVELRGAGQKFLGLCPFHQEKTPSFQVRDDLGRYKCFGCGASGDIFEFLMRLRGLSFKEAVDELALKAGISAAPGLKKTGPHVPLDRAQAWLLANRVAHKYFKDQLLGKESGHLARRYLEKERKLTLPMIEQAALGFGGTSKDDFVSFLKSNGVSAESALAAGLLQKGQYSLIAPFLNRIIFPIRRMDGRVVAFGGRSFLKSEAETPKYVNTHGTGLYEKRKSFYGLFESRAGILRGQVPCLVEGYFDAMAMWAAGVPALALCGTALSPEHAILLKRLSSRLNISFDNDAAGLKALRSSLVLLFAQGIQASVVALYKKDPGEYLATGELAALAEQLEKPTDALCHAIDHMAFGGSGDIANRIAQIDELMPIFASITRPLIRRQYVVYLANKLHEDPSLLWMEISGRKKTPTPMRAPEIKAPPILNSEERLLAPLFLAYPELIQQMLGLEEMISPDFLNFFLQGQDMPLGPLIRALGEDGAVLPLGEAQAVIRALHHRVIKSKTKKVLRMQRQKLLQAQKDNDFSLVVANLKEQSLVLKEGQTKKKPKALMPEKKVPEISSTRVKVATSEMHVDQGEEEGWY